MRLLDSLDELAPLDMGDHILILPEDMPMKEAINRYCIFLSTGYYAEYLHCRNSRSVLDGMVDHKGNMILLNERYTDGIYITNPLLQYKEKKNIVFNTSRVGKGVHDR